MKHIALLHSSLLLLTSLAAEAALPTARQIEWADCEIGVIIHQDVQVHCPAYARMHDTNVPPASVFNPTDLSTDQWIETAKAAGAKYAVLVAKHCSGFSLWPTKAHGYSVASSPWKGGKGDVVADFIASCRKYGLRPGIYASTGANAYAGIRGWKNVPDAKWRGYVELVKTQLAELWTNYGELFEIWFDGGNLPQEKGGREIEDLLVRLQPNAIVFQGNPARSATVRWIGNERAHAPEVCWNRVDFGTGSDGTFEATGPDYTGSFDGRYWCPGEADMPNRDQNFALQGGWFWREGDDCHVYPAEVLLERYFTSVGRNCNLLLGMVIDNRGRVPDADVREFRRFGELVKGLYANPVAETSGKGRFEDYSYVWEVAAPVAARPDLLSLQEDLRFGENQKTFSLAGFDGQAWHTLASGYNIGHRRLVRFRPGPYVKYRLTLGWPRKGAEPVLRSFALYE